MRGGEPVGTHLKLTMNDDGHSSFGCHLVVFKHGQLFSYVGGHFHWWGLIFICGGTFSYVGDHFLNVGACLRMCVVIGGHLLLCFNRVVLCHCRCSPFIGCRNVGSWHCGRLLM